MYFSKTTIIAIAALLAQGFALPLEGSTAPCTTASCCDLQDNTCRTAPGASQADCSSAKNTCYLNAGLPSPYSKRVDGSTAPCEKGAGAKDCCDSQDNACRTAPGASQADCSAAKNTCYLNVGLPSPYAKRVEGSTAPCEKGAGAKDCCDAQDNTCRTAPGASMADCSAAKNTCYLNVGLPSPYAKRVDGSTAPCEKGAGAKDCCDAQDNTCRTAPGASMADCSSAKNTCYLNAGLPSPYAKRVEGSTAPCEKGAGAKDCCDAQDNTCRTAPGASMADCSSAKNTCYLNAGLPSPYA